MGIDEIKSESPSSTPNSNPHLTETIDIKNLFEFKHIIGRGGFSKVSSI